MLVLVKDTIFFISIIKYSLAFALFFCHAEYVKKYFLPFTIFGFLLISFFVFSAKHNTAYALNAGQNCFLAQGCGKNTLVCVPDNKTCGIQGSCNTGVCTAKTATSGPCKPQASICNTNTGYTCALSPANQNCSNAPGAIGVAQCTYACQLAKQKSGTCDPNNSNTCDAKTGFACLKSPNDPSNCGSIGAPTCNFSCQQKNKTSGSCNPNNSLCDASKGFACLKNATDPSNCGSIGGSACNFSCQLQKKTSGTCNPNNSLCDTSKGFACLQSATDPSNCGSIGGAACHYTCQQKNKTSGTCNPNNSTCDTSKGYQCLKSTTDPSNCGSIGGAACHYTCQQPQQPQEPTHIPPPPSPPCKQWSPNGVCLTFNSPFNTTNGGFPTDPAGFIQKIFAVLLSVSGGIALLLIIKAGYQLMTAQGKPEQLQNGRDQLIAAIVGLIFLIFSFVFLQLIGFDILHIPGFTGPNGTVTAQYCTSAGLQYCSKIQQCFPASSTCP